MIKNKLKCAIYTRKSTEEGLEQDFNSLDAQREACEAYIKSQQHKGWILVEKQYNDVGFSGGNLERPALKELFKDIENNKIDIVVVYKVDRLTRSLLDFAKIVELFDSHEASFVSVTQNFNTTTSMGRLTLNILLSFAQFEREVTGERIRDKIAASKKKGMWMGGRVPIGYIIQNKKLIVDKINAQKVIAIFKKYLELKSVPKLKEYLLKNNIKSDSDSFFEKGQLYHILKNNIYTGKIVHKGNIYDGEHTGIIEEKIFNEVQKLLLENATECKNNKSSNSILAGKIFDDKGNRMSPSHSKTRNKKYRYYVSQAITKFNKEKAGSISKLPAEEIEKFIIEEIKAYLSDTAKIQSYISGLSLEQQNQIIKILKEKIIFYDKVVPKILLKVTISEKWIEVILSHNKIKEFLYTLINKDFSKNENNDSNITIKRNIQITTGNTKGCKVLIIRKDVKADHFINETLIKVIVRSFYWHKLIITGQAKNSKDIQKFEKLKNDSYIKQVLNLRFLSSKIIESILNGNQPKNLTITKLFKIKTLNWQEQEQILLG